MDERIKKVAQKLQKSIKNYDDVGSVHQGVRIIARDQTDYFLHFGPDFLIKLTLYIYSLKKTGDLKLGEKMINNLSFIQLLVTDNEPSIKECKSCDGSGMEICDRCKGIGFIECPKCEGDGEVSCEWCDAYNSDECDECLGEETMNCDKCGGEGGIHCPTCRGESEIVCQTCGGEGEIVDEDEVDYEIYFIATWDKQIQSLLELRVGTLDPIMSEYQFSELSDKYLELSNYESAAPLNVSENEMYCIDYSDEPQLFLEKNMSIRTINRYLDTINKNYLYL
jgi:hypothetical protein